MTQTTHAVSWQLQNGRLLMQPHQSSLTAPQGTEQQSHLILLPLALFPALDILLQPFLLPPLTCQLCLSNFQGLQCSPCLVCDVGVKT